MPTIFFTGFPGFLGSELLPRVLERSPGSGAVCLVQPKFAALARARADELERGHPALAGRVRIVEGDITRPDLGLGDARELEADTVEVYHLAAVYDLSVAREVGMRVNVDGTRNVLALARRCPGLRRFQYVSTCYVSGRHPGTFAEDDLEVGQEFNNFYEETKYLAEVEVRRAMRDGLPATIYRPSIVVGDSATGATQKYDGPYFAIRWLLRQPKIAVMTVVGDTTRTEFNVVPRDFVVDAIAYLSGRAESEGRTYNLADPHPLTVDGMLTDLARATGRRMIRVPLPLRVAKGALDHVPGVYRLMRIPSSAVDYFVHPTRYATERTQAALAGSGIRVPRFPEYSDRLVAFVRAHPEIGAAAMV
ncbi:MAG: SDR family oxidoreductase [Gemmatimonadetes bacterium]|nr:SDR family oxidoreductase [Gemmatimonadota bacterium]